MFWENYVSLLEPQSKRNQEPQLVVIQQISDHSFNLYIEKNHLVNAYSQTRDLGIGVGEKIDFGYISD